MNLQCIEEYLKKAYMYWKMAINLFEIKKNIYKYLNY